MRGATPSASRCPNRSGRVTELALTAAFAGTVLSVEVSPGEAVRAGDVLVVLESMKMEHVLEASSGGVIDSVAVTVGDAIQTGDVILKMTVTADEPVVVIDPTGSTSPACRLRPPNGPIRLTRCVDLLPSVDGTSNPPRTASESRAPL